VELNDFAVLVCGTLGGSWKLEGRVGSLMKLVEFETILKKNFGKLNLSSTLVMKIQLESSRKNLEV
jgi:hypothetical protein